MKKLLMFLFAIVFSSLTWGQSTVNYSFSTNTTGSLTVDANSNAIDMTSGITALVGASSDQGVSALTNIGFTFALMGNTYTQFSASANGIMQLGSVVVSGSTYVASGGTTTSPKFSACGADAATSSTGSITSKLIGTAPNRCLVVQWTDMALYYGNTTADGTFQVRLYETSGKIEFVYGKMIVGASTYTSNFSTGFSTNTTANNLACITTSTNTVSTSTFTANAYAANTAVPNLNSSADGSRRVYTFTPPQTAPSAPAMAATPFTAINYTTMTLNWVDVTGEAGYAIYRSTDGVNYTFVTNLAANTITYAATSLAPGTTYSWQIYSFNEAKFSSATSSNQATTATGNITSTATGGNWNAVGTWVGGIVPGQYDNVTIANGATVTINATSLQCYNLTVGQGTSGVLRFGTNAATFTVNGGVTVAAGGTFEAGAPAGASLSHILYIGGATATSNFAAGSLTVNGIFDMYIGSTNGKASVTFFGSQDAIISGTGATCDFNTITINKGAVTASSTATPPLLDIQRTFTVQGANTVGLVTALTAGTLKISGSFTLATPLFVTAGYSIPSISALWLNNANFTASAQAGSPTLTGLLKMTAGTLNIGTTTGQSLGMASSSTAIIEGGTITVAGRFNVSSSSNTITYNQSGGILNVCNVEHTSTSYSFDMGTSTNTKFTMSGGIINIIRGSSATKVGGYDFRGAATGATINITGGILNIGSSATVSGCNYKILGVAPNTIVDATNNPNLTLGADTRIYGDFTFNGSGTFSLSTLYNLDMRGMNASYPGNITNNGIFTLNANSGTTQSLTFSSSFGNQTFTNNGTITDYVIPKLTINNTFAGGIVTLPDNLNLTYGASSGVTLILNQGILSANNLTIGSAGTAGFTATIKNGSLANVPTFNFGTGTISYTYNGTLAQQTIGEEMPTSIYGTLTINNALGVVLGKAINIDALTLTGGELNTGGFDLKVTGTTAAKVTRTNGYVNGALIRTLPANLATGTTYVFPLAKTSSTYRPLSLVNAVTGNKGIVEIKAEVFDDNCGGNFGNNMSSINTDRYWKAEYLSGGDNVTGITVQLTETGMNTTSGIGQSVDQGGNYDLVSLNAPSGNTITSSTITGLGYFVIGQKSLPMAVTSSTSTQTIVTPVYANTIDQQILGIQIVTAGNASPISATSFDLNTTGTTNLSDITNAKIYYTGTTNTFATTNLFGNAIPASSYSISGSQVLAEGTNYFWLVYDISSSATYDNLIDAECTSITVEGAAYTPTVTAPAGTRQIKDRLAGTVYVGTGQQFTSLTGAGGLFERINLYGLKGNVVAKITSNTTGDGANALNQWVEDVNGANYTLTIEPNDANVYTLTGSYAGGLIRLNGADRVTIDGRFGGSGNYLTFNNTSTSGSAVFQIISLGTGLGANNNTIRNCNILTGSISATTYGIFAGSATLGTAADDNDNLTITENVISKCYNGIYVSSASTGAGVLNNLTISNNTIGSNTATDYVINKGIFVQGALASSIAQNQIFNMITSTGINNAAIELGQYVSDAIVNKNKIYSIKSTSTSGYGAYGINIATATGTSNITISNNVIYDLITSNYSATSTTYNAFGIRITGGTNHKVYYNSVNLFGAVSGGSAAGMSAAFLATAGTGLEVVNNIFNNSTAFTTVGAKTYAAYVVTGTTFTTINNNDYSASGTYGILGYYGAADATTIVAWRTASTQDANSINVQPVFISNTDLHLDNALNDGINNKGAVIPLVTVDYDGVSRNATNPDLGAFEFTPPSCIGATAGTASVTASTFCGSGTPVITATASSLGGEYQWEYSNDNFVADIHNVLGQIDPFTLSTGIVSTTTYYRLKVSCTSASAVSYSNILQITINPNPTVNVTPNTGSYCGTGSVSLTTSGNSDTYSWLPATGLDVTTGANVVASPTSTKTYTVRGTITATGCYADATATITVKPIPTNLTATASNSEVCSGSSFNLFSSADNNITNTYINPTADGGFENGSTFALNNWTVLNGTYNQWLIGTAAGAQDGTNAAYVGTGFVGTANASVNHFYRDVVIPSGATNISLKFFLKMPIVDGGYDYMKVYTTTAAYTPVAGTTPSTGYTERFTYDAPALSSFTLQTINLPDALAGTTVRLVFTFKCDGVTPFGVPAVDNISLSTSVATTNTYAWTSSPVGFTSALQNPTGITQSANTTYTVTATNDYNCTATASKTVNNVSGAAISTQPIATAKCSGQTASFTVTATGPNLTYQWYKGVDAIIVANNGSANAATLELANVSDVDAGNYYVVVNAACGTPVTSDVVSLTVNHYPTATASSNSPVCDGSTLNLTGTTDIGVTYEWKKSDVIISTNQILFISSVTAANAGTYSFTATKNGCTSIAGTVDVIVNAVPTAVSITPNSASIAQGSIQSLVASGGTISNVSILNENFNGLTNSWTNTNTSTGGAPANAAWTLRADAYSYSSTTIHSNDNSQFYMSNSDAQGSGGTTATTLCSPSFSTLGFISANISFYHYYYHYTGSTAKVEVSTDGVIWTTLQTYNSTVGTASSFVIANVSLTAPFLNQATVYMRFKYDGVYAFYWAIDNVSIIGDGQATTTWSPATNLFTDAFATIPYTLGANATTVYAKPTANRVYTATATSGAGCQSNGTATINIGPTRTWSSTATSTDWNVAGNWTNGIPANIDNVVIPATATKYPTLTGDVTINNLTIESSAAGTGSLLDNSHLTLTGTATVKQYIVGNKWHILSSPVQTATANVFHLAAGQADIYIREYNAGAWSYITNLTTPLTVGKGYSIWADIGLPVVNKPNPTVSFNGQINTGNVTINMNPWSAPNTGWNFIGNPYTSAIDWSLVPDKATILNNGGAAYFWNQNLNANEGAYATHNGTISVNGATSIIPPMQGFLVQAANTSITFTNASRVHNDNNQPIYKSTASINDMIRIKAKRGIYTDETVILMNSNATNNFDASLDALKMFASNNNSPEIYTIANNNNLVINNFGTYPAAIPMNIRMGVADNVTLTASEFANFDANVNITLEDILTGTNQDLRQNPSYTFAASIGENANRFVLHFATASGINEPNAGNINIYANNNNIYVNTTEKVKEISVYNMLGQVITKISGNGKSLNTISMNNATGNYVVKVTTEKGVRTEKVFVK